MNYHVFPQHSLLSNIFPNEISNLILEFIFKPQAYKKDINPLYQKFKIIQVINTTETEFDYYYQIYRNISYFKDDNYYYSFKQKPISIITTIKNSQFLKTVTFDTFYKKYIDEFRKDKHIIDICNDSFQIQQLYTI